MSGRKPGLTATKARSISLGRALSRPPGLEAFPESRTSSRAAPHGAEIAASGTRPCSCRACAIRSGRGCRPGKGPWPPRSRPAGRSARSARRSSDSPARAAARGRAPRSRGRCRSRIGRAPAGPRSRRSRATRTGRGHRSRTAPGRRVAGFPGPGMRAARQRKSRRPRRSADRLGDQGAPACTGRVGVFCGRGPVDAPIPCPSRSPMKPSPRGSRNRSGASAVGDDHRRPEQNRRGMKSKAPGTPARLADALEADDPRGESSRTGSHGRELVRDRPEHERVGAGRQARVERPDFAPLRRIDLAGEHRSPQAIAQGGNQPPATCIGRSTGSFHNFDHVGDARRRSRLRLSVWEAACVS